MSKNKNVYFAMVAVLGCLMLLAPAVLAENEPNDTQMESEVSGEGTFTGSVNATDMDYYMFTVPGEKDIVVTGEKTNPEGGTITITGYEADLPSLPVISLTLTTQGVQVEDSDWNIGVATSTYYLRIEGEGDYEFTVQYTDESQEDLDEAVEGLAAACGATMLLMICLPIGVIIVIIIIIVIIVKKKK